MKNIEKYKDEILEMVKEECCDFACAITSVANSDCRECDYDCVECYKRTLNWLLAEYKEPIKITLFEKSILECAVEYGFEYIARESNNGSLCVYEDYPSKGIARWYCTGDYLRLKLFNNKFQFIKWEDEEPVHIPTLLKECEVV